MNKRQRKALRPLAARRSLSSGGAAPKPRGKVMNVWGRARAVVVIVGLSAAAVGGCGSSPSPTSTRKASGGFLNAFTGASAPATATAANQALEHHFVSCIERAGWRVSAVADRDAASELMAKQPGLRKMVGVRSATGAAASVGFFTSVRAARLAGMKVGGAVPGHGHATARQGIAIGWINFSGAAHVDELLSNCA